MGARTANLPPSPLVYPDAGKSEPAEGRASPNRLDEAQLRPLVELARDGDVAAFEEIVRTMQGPVRSFARRMMRDGHSGDDAAQETFLRMWKGLRTHEPRGRFIAWSFTIARNTCIELLRKEKRTPVPVEVNDRLGDDPTEASDLRQIVHGAIADLDEPFRSTFLLRQTGLAYDELSHALGCPIGTVRSRLHEARRRLQASLRPILEGGA